MKQTRTGGRSNLPAELSSFVGRRHELAHVRSVLAAHRLVTLIGPGGVGKTRLALRAAADLAEEYAEGVWVVELAPVHDPELVTNTVVAALRLQDASGASPVDKLVEHLQERSLLLVLDNCEHVQEAVAALTSRLLSCCTALNVVATSRHALGVEDEHLLPVTPLPVPSPGRDGRSPKGLMHYDSVRLFSERATASWPAFEVTDSNQQAVTDLVRRLDGLPLAIELAAVRVRSLSVQQILDRLTDRFRLLNNGDRAALPRQQTLRALFEWSHDLLSPEEGALWERASVFAGSFDLRDLEAVVCDGSLPPARLAGLADGLVTKSILIRESGSGDPRFHMLESVKEYGLTKLGQEEQLEQLRQCHLDHYRGEAVGAARGMFGAEGVGWFHRLRHEHDDLRAALERCLRAPGLAEQGCALAGSLQHYWVMTGRFSEGRHWVHRLLGRQPAPGLGRASARVVGGRLAVLQGDVEEGRGLLEKGLAEATELGLTTWRAHALHGLAISALFWEEPASAQVMLEEALSLHRGGDDPMGVPLAHIQLATLHATLGESDQAMAHAEECIALSQKSGDQWCAAMARWTQALVAWRQGRAVQVRTYAREVLRLKEPFGDRLGMAMSMEMLAWAASKQGRHAEAGQLFGAVQTALRSIGGSLFRHLGVDHDRCVDLTRAALGDAEFDRHVGAGSALEFEDALALALGRRKGVEAQRSRASARDRTRLTRRETEVARLVAEGLTDHQVAERLVVAQRTAEGHVQRALTKLGLTSRQQLAGWVAEQRNPPPLG